MLRLRRHDPGADRSTCWKPWRRGSMESPPHPASATGWPADAGRQRCAAGHLHRIHRGVYAVGHRRLTRKGRFMAAVLAAPPPQPSRTGPPPPYSIFVPPNARESRSRSRIATVRTRAGIQAHTACLLAQDVATVDIIPCTSVARTLLDLAAVLDTPGLRRAVSGRRCCGSSTSRRWRRSSHGPRDTAAWRSFAIARPPPARDPHPLRARGGIPRPLQNSLPAQPRGQRPHRGGRHGARGRLPLAVRPPGRGDWTATRPMGPARRSSGIAAATRC